MTNDERRLAQARLTGAASGLGVFTLIALTTAQDVRAAAIAGSMALLYVLLYVLVTFRLTRRVNSDDD